MKYVKGNLFGAPDTTSLAHCVSKDMYMGAGIAKMFKRKYGRETDLLRQNKRVGEVATLRLYKRNIYYIITKEKYYNKPTYADFGSAITALRNACIKDGVKQLAIPMLGCGLDRLHWKKVKEIIETKFEHTDVEITVYYL